MKSYLVTWANHVSPGEGNLKMQMIITSEELVNVNELYCPVLADRFCQIDDRGDPLQKIAFHASVPRWSREENKWSGNLR